MTKNEKRLWIVVTVIALVVLWLWLRGSKRGQDIYNQITEALNLPGLSAPVIDVGDGNEYDIANAAMPDVIPSSSYSGCSMCGEKTVELAYPAPITIIEQAPVYTPPPPVKKKKKMSIGHSWDTSPKKPIYSMTGQFVGWL